MRPPKRRAILILDIKALRRPRSQPGEPMDLANIARQRRAFARGGRASSADARPIANALGVRLWPIPAVTSILSARQLYGDKLPIKFFGDLANSVFADLTPVRHLFGGAREAPRCERLRSGSGWTAGARQRRAMLKLVACGIAQQSADSLMAAWPKSSST